ncbi:MAG: nucleotidyltransferase family protein [Lachnospiraceae bacterium]|nr:nucleotidyltransferase family protein [Lachnospiraceae bacterium]
MKTAAIITEYNPFHNGHAYQLSEVQKRSDADFLIILMSGDFVQRGTPALFDKFVRTETALLCGADLVLELPLAFATGSAQRFAEGAVSILNGLEIVDELWFGSEEGALETFTLLADILKEEPEKYQDLLKEHLKKGLSYPAARSAALGEYCSRPDLLSKTMDSDSFRSNATDADSHSREAVQNPVYIEEFLKKPNNILGLEYVLALKKLNSSIRPRTLQRTGSGYHAEQLEGVFSSATAIRREIAEKGFSGVQESIKTAVPEQCFSLYKENASKNRFVLENQVSEALRYQLWKESPDSLCSYLDISQELANRIINLRPEFRSFTQFAELLQTRNQTRTALQRALLHILLGITWEDAEISVPSQPMGKSGISPVPLSSGQRLIRMLGLSLSARKGGLLSGIPKDGPIAITANPGTHPLSGQYEKELFASQYYESLISRNSGEAFIPEYSRKLVLK